MRGPNRGRGIATGFWFNGSGPSSATASVDQDGTVSLIEGSPDIGGSRAAVAMQMAEVLGLPAEDVHPSIGDTDSIGFTSTTGGSGVAFKTGWASYEAAQDIKRQMIERAAYIWDVPAEKRRLGGRRVPAPVRPGTALHVQGVSVAATGDGRADCWSSCRQSRWRGRGLRHPYSGR